MDVRTSRTLNFFSEFIELIKLNSFFYELIELYSYFWWINRIEFIFMK